MSSSQRSESPAPEEPRFIEDSNGQRRLWLLIALLAIAAVGALGFFICKPKNNSRPGGPTKEVEKSRSEFTGGPDSTAPPAVGQQAPALAVQGLEPRGALSLPLKGRPQVLEFIATWCKYCQQMTPVLSSEIVRQNPKIRLVVIGSARESDNKIKQFSAKFSNQRLTAAPLIVNDRGLAIANRYQIQGYPTMVFIDRRGKIAAITAGVQEREILAAALQKISN